MDEPLSGLADSDCIEVGHGRHEALRRPGECAAES